MTSLGILCPRASDKNHDAGTSERVPFPEGRIV